MIKRFLNPMFFVGLFAMSPIRAHAVEERPTDLAGCQSASECTLAIDFETCEVVAINKNHKDALKRKHAPLEEMTAFDAECANQPHDLKKVRVRCRQNACELTMDGKTYISKYNLLIDYSDSELQK